MTQRPVPNVSTQRPSRRGRLQKESIGRHRGFSQWQDPDRTEDTTIFSRVGLLRVRGLPGFCTRFPRGTADGGSVGLFVAPRSATAINIVVPLLNDACFGGP